MSHIYDEIGCVAVTLAKDINKEEIKEIKSNTRYNFN